MSRLISTLVSIWRLALPYYVSEDRRAGRILLGAVLLIELSIVAITVLLNQWNARFYNALQDRNWDSFVNELLLFCGLAAAFILLAVYQLYLNQWLQIRWRRWMTEQYLDLWLTGGNHYRMQLLGDEADNPDQRIAEDIAMFIDRALSLGVGLLSAVVTLGSFVVILWTLSEAAPLQLFGVTYAIPGYLVWVALIYAVAGTALTHIIGWPLVALNYRQQRFEADFRFNLVRVRENAEQIALLGGEAAERERLLDRFSRVVTNWVEIMQRTKKLTFLTAGYTQVSTVFPFVVISPAYFAGVVQLGGLTQTASAFGSVQNAMSFFINSYRTLAEWGAVIDRLEGFNAAVTHAKAAAVAAPSIAVAAGETDTVTIDDLLLRLPQGMPLAVADDITISPGERVLMTGASGTGKSTLFRAIAGRWPFGDGTVTIPKGAKLLVLPQRPYFPLGSLAAAVSYPAKPGTFGDERLAETIVAAGLPALASRLHEEAHWNRMLSLGEQQRLGVARALLQAPDILLLDEATASLDEPAESDLYALIAERLPRATLISIGHRSTLAAFHRRTLTLIRDGSAPARLQTSPAAPALPAS